MALTASEAQMAVAKDHFAAAQRPVHAMSPIEMALHAVVLNWKVVQFLSAEDPKLLEQCRLALGMIVEECADGCREDPNFLV